MREGEHYGKVLSTLVIIFAFFPAENSETQSRKHESLKARNKTIVFAYVTGLVEEEQVFPVGVST
jgi:hypothetical protein